LIKKLLAYPYAGYIIDTDEIWTRNFVPAAVHWAVVTNLPFAARHKRAELTLKPSNKNKTTSGLNFNQTD
jgi:hypothetical protein